MLTTPPPLPHRPPACPRRPTTPCPSGPTRRRPSSCSPTCAPRAALRPSCATRPPSTRSSSLTGAPAACSSLPRRRWLPTNRAGARPCCAVGPRLDRRRHGPEAARGGAGRAVRQPEVAQSPPHPACWAALRSAQPAPPQPPSRTRPRASLRECEADEQMSTLVPDIVGADPMAAALLIECRGRDADTLQSSIDEVRLRGGGRLRLRPGACCKACWFAGPHRGACMPQRARMGAECGPRLTPAVCAAAALPQVHRALRRHGLPFGAKAVDPKPLDTYPFSHDAKVGGRCRRRGAACPLPAAKARSCAQLPARQPARRAAQCTTPVRARPTRRPHPNHDPSPSPPGHPRPDLQGVLGRAQGADSHCGRRARAGHVHADRGRRVPRGQAGGHDDRPGGHVPGGGRGAGWGARKGAAPVGGRLGPGSGMC